MRTDTLTISERALVARVLRRLSNAATMLATTAAILLASGLAVMLNLS
jgi:hypothetical protein